MHKYVISPAAPLFLVHPSIPPARHVSSGQLFARNASSVMTRRYKEVAHVESVSAVSIRTRTRVARDNFVEQVWGKTQVFDSV
jgi:hypothetical protein